MIVLLILTIGGNANEIALAFPVASSDILLAVSFECNLPVNIPSLIRGVFVAGVPSSSNS